MVVSAGAGDVVRFTGAQPGQHYTVVVDGLTSTGCVNDKVFLGDNLSSFRQTVDVPVGNLLSSVLPSFLPRLVACHSEVVVFAKNYAVSVRQNISSWTSGNDVLPMPMRAEIEVPLAIRVLVADPDALQKAHDDPSHASSIYFDMAGGVRFLGDVKDVSGDPAAPMLLQSDCTNAAQFKSVGFTDNRINVYYIDKVQNDDTIKGQWCGDDNLEPDIILISAPIDDPQNLAHEIGHAFSLRHTVIIDGFGQVVTMPGIDPFNLMQPKGPNRKYLTNGQVFRAHVNGFSMLNVNGLRPGGPTHLCANTTSTTDDCPPVPFDVPQK